MVDYESNEYHERRHPEYKNDHLLRNAWSCFANDSYFKNLEAGDSVLEFGGGFGYNLLTVMKRAKVTMLELSEIGRELAYKEGIDTISSMDDAIKYNYDAILCRHVLEHVDHPLVVLKELREYLNQNGKLILVLPCEDMKLFPSESDIDYHLYSWSPRLISNLLEKANYSVDSISYEYYGAKRKLLPIYKIFGDEFYVKLVRFVGKLFGFKEIVVFASVKP